MSLGNLSGDAEFRTLLRARLSSAALPDEDGLTQWFSASGNDDFPTVFMFESQRNLPVPFL